MLLINWKPLTCFHFNISQTKFFYKPHTSISAMGGSPTISLPYFTLLFQKGDLVCLLYSQVSRNSRVNNLILVEDHLFSFRSRSLNRIRVSWSKHWNTNVTWYRHYTLVYLVLIIYLVSNYLVHKGTRSK